MKYKIIGDNLQVVNVELSEGESVYSEAGRLVYKSENVEMEAEVKGGFTEAIKRVLTRESFFVTKFTCKKGTGLVGFAGDLPGKIKVISLPANESFITERGAFLCAEMSVTIDFEFAKIGAAFFGGEGFILQKLNGPGNVFIHAVGDLIEYDLKANESIQVATSHIVGFDSTVDYDVQRAGDIKTVLFGGQGILLARLTGPGRVVLQSMTKEKMSAELGIPPKAALAAGIGAGIGAKVGGEIIKGMLKR
ncbi:MAG: TIGR00266 family protein [Candidatus Aenigmarchaeota archaeon]|nr:TIGR00266 family protein [Candidatus Aenigmarchaeota archaeon]